MLKLWAGEASITMADEKEPITIKKYANRRLYNTGTSTYVTLEDLAVMVKDGENFVVYDAKTGEDITRSVLAQIIFEQENKEGQSLLPIAFLRQLIRFYGDSMQMMVPRFLEQSMQVAHQRTGQVPRADGASLRRRRLRPARGSGAAEHGNVREDLRHVRTLRARPGQSRRGRQARVRWRGGEMDELKRQLDEMQKRLDRLGDKELTRQADAARPTSPRPRAGASMRARSARLADNRSPNRPAVAAASSSCTHSATVLRPKSPRQIDQRLHEGAIVVRLDDVLHEGAVDLDDIDAELAQIAERGVAGAEIVDGDAATEILDARDEAAGIVDVLDRRASR